jgi:hypothetical protein
MTALKRRDELRPEYDLSKLGPAVRGKYFERCRAGTLIIENGMEPPRKRRARKKGGATKAKARSR